MNKMCKDCDALTMVGIGDGFLYGCEKLRDFIDIDKGPLPNCPKLVVKLSYSDISEILQGLLDKSIKEQDREQDMWSNGYQCAIHDVANVVYGIINNTEGNIFE